MLTYLCGQCKLSQTNRYSTSLQKNKVMLTCLLRRLEATFGIIAAAAPSVRPLLGHNSVTTNYYSRDKSHSLPLRTTRTGRTSRIEWGHTVFDTRNDPDERDDFGGDSESQLRLDDRGIMKTTSIEVVTTLGHTVESDMDGRPTSEESTERRYV